MKSQQNRIELVTRPALKFITSTMPRPLTLPKEESFDRISRLAMAGAAKTVPTLAPMVQLGAEDQARTVQ